MALLILGLVLFLGAHAVSMVRDVRAGLVERFGAGGYKAAYSFASAIGLVLIVWGFVQYRQSGLIPVWTPPTAMRHIALLLMLPAMTLLFVYLLPAGRLKGLARHPMLLMLKIWALTHLLANGDLGGIVLFGSFLAYAFIDRISLKRRAGGEVAPAVSWNAYDGWALMLGLVGYLAMVYVVHPMLFGIPVLPGR